MNDVVVDAKQKMSKNVNEAPRQVVAPTEAPKQLTDKYGLGRHTRPQLIYQSYTTLCT